MNETRAGDGLAEIIDDQTVMVVWPGIAATRLGRLVGRLYAVPFGLGGFFTLGKLLAVVTIPLSLAVFGWQLLPFVARRYRLTTTRIAIEAGLSATPLASIGLDAFDAVRVETLPGQDWLSAGEVQLVCGGQEVFRLSGVSRPDVFRQIVLKTQAAAAGVRDVLRPHELA